MREVQVENVEGKVMRNQKCKMQNRKTMSMGSIILLVGLISHGNDNSNYASAFTTSTSTRVKRTKNFISYKPLPTIHNQFSNNDNDGSLCNTHVLKRHQTKINAQNFSLRYTTTLQAVAAASTVTHPINADENQPKSAVNDFQPTTMSLTTSMLYFAKYLIQQRKEDQIKIQLSRKNKPRFLSKLLRRRKDEYITQRYDPKLIQRLQSEIDQGQSEKKPFSETLSRLNKARKEMIELVGYNAALLIPCFGFAGLAAFMNSVIPHYYGLCINCLANASTTTQSDVVRAITGLAGASFLCALFTGARGALFWLAGEWNEG